MLTIPVLADELTDFYDIERASEGQKSITNKQFEEALNLLQKNKIKKEEKAKKKKLKKISGGGTSLHTELNPDKTINEFESLKASDKEDLLLNFPVDVFIDDVLLEKGYYKVVAKRNNDNRIYLNFYQSQYLKATVEATETKDDFGEKEVDFVKIQEYNGSYAKLIFGSLDFNAYAYLPYVQ